MSDREFWQGRLDQKKALLLLYDAAIDALVVQEMESYTLDTGQTRTTVTKLNVPKMQEMVENLENQIAVLQTRITGCGTTTVRPCW